MASPDGRNNGSVKRRIAATAATAAIALSSPTLATSLDVSRRAEMGEHRHMLAGALGAELGGGSAGPRLERAMEVAEAQINDAYARGERPRFAGGLPVALGESTGMSEAELAEAFESMSRHALERRRGIAT